MSHSLHFVLALALAAALPAARADVIDIKWSADGSFAHQSTVAPGKFAEVCGKLPASISVRWDFEASAPLDFNIHYHAGKDVVFPSKMAAMATANDTLQTSLAQDYCWMWSNKLAKPATLTLKLQR